MGYIVSDGLIESMMSVDGIPELFKAKKEAKKEAKGEPSAAAKASAETPKASGDSDDEELQEVEGYGFFCFSKPILY